LGRLSKIQGLHKNQNHLIPIQALTPCNSGLSTTGRTSMLQCSFELNNQPMSAFKIGAISAPAFSGLAPHINRRAASCLPDLGPIPIGRYYVVDRESGGRPRWLRDTFGIQKEWFALYAADKKIDDETFCDQVQRGHFRLHPKGPRGISKGCIVIEKLTDFHCIRAFLRGAGKQLIPGSTLRTYGMVTVK
jgi:hypothetical protein